LESSMKIGIPKEVYSLEKRVAATPEVVKDLIKLGFEVNVNQKLGISHPLPMIFIKNRERA